MATPTKSSRWEARVGDRPATGAALIPGVLHRGATVMLTTLAVLAALGLTAYAVLVDIRSPALDVLGGYRLDLDDNLNAAVVFFWIELFAIVGGMRIYDRATTRARVRQTIRAKLSGMYNALRTAIGEIHDERYAFAVELDARPRDDGGYDVNMAQLNQKIVEIRRRFIVSELGDTEHTVNSDLLLGRVLRSLDLIANETFEIGGRIEMLNAPVNHTEEAEVLAPPAETTTSAENTGPTPPQPRLTKPELEAALVELFEATKPDRNGLDDIAVMIEESFNAPRLGGRRRR